jgi:hypothetical protein
VGQTVGGGFSDPFGAHCPGRGRGREGEGPGVILARSGFGGRPSEGLVDPGPATAGRLSLRKRPAAAHGGPALLISSLERRGGFSGFRAPTLSRGLSVT